MKFKRKRKQKSRPSQKSVSAILDGMVELDRLRRADPDFEDDGGGVEITDFGSGRTVTLGGEPEHE